MLARLETGLTQEGLRVLRVWPGSAPAGPPRSAFAVPVSFEDEGLAATLPIRAARLADSITDAVGRDAAAATVFHAFGEECWEIASRAALALDAPLAVQAWRPDSAPSLARLVSHRKSRGASSSRGGESAPATSAPPLACIAPDAALATLMEQGAPGTPVLTASWGVHAPDFTRAAWLTRDRTDSVAFVVVGSGADEAACVAAISGLALAAEADPRVTVFVDAAIVRRRRSLWRPMRAGDAAERFTLVEGLEARRAVALRADVLVQPEARGERRSITLDALASGMVVLARRDPAWPALAGADAPDAAPATFVAATNPRDWCDAALAILRDPSLAQRRSSEGGAWAARHASAFAQVAATIAAYERIGGATPIPFAGVR